MCSYRVCTFTWGVRVRSHTKRHKSTVHILLVGCTVGVVVLTVLQSKIPSGELLLRKIVLLKPIISPFSVGGDFQVCWNEKTKYYDLTRQKQLILNGWILNIPTPHCFRHHSWPSFCTSSNTGSGNRKVYTHGISRAVIDICGRRPLWQM